MSKTEAIEKVLYPYIHRKLKLRRFWPKVKAMLMRVYPQQGGDRVLEIRIHESDLLAAREALKRLTQIEDGDRS